MRFLVGGAFGVRIRPGAQVLSGQPDRLDDLVQGVLIALGRPFLANPDLVTRLRLGAPLNEPRDRYFMYVGGAAGYTDYPALDDQPAGASSDSIVALDGGRVA
ncbi:hypothetical protein GCM10010103_35780 [Streptomyces paradoxus]|uniref:2,4-dienoyl-CoA reductase-like NADH-dependent reductase (Old Yellow Enzyme family) n=1 Tax=Streptomyces paradoxus TaxID=66375 RepID=A0A7W9TDS1_9ACTN|nr:2,4-dienoyl-CoA reductase-like NADH-dependent reductase (Old Yellow Enzyme family) [Streptomyces paradoxus]